MSAASFQTSCCLGAFLLLRSAAAMPARLAAGTGWGRPPLMVVQCLGGAILVHCACLGMYAIAMPHHLHTGRPARVLAACVPCGGTGGWAGPMLIFSTIRQVTCRPLSRGNAAHASSHAGPCCRNAIVAGSPCRLSATAACTSRPDLESVCRRTNMQPHIPLHRIRLPLTNPPQPQTPSVRLRVSRQRTSRFSVASTDIAFRFVVACSAEQPHLWAFGEPGDISDVWHILVAVQTILSSTLHTTWLLLQVPHSSHRCLQHMYGTLVWQAAIWLYLSEINSRKKDLCRHQVWIRSTEIPSKNTANRCSITCSTVVMLHCVWPNS